MLRHRMLAKGHSKKGLRVCHSDPPLHQRPEPARTWAQIAPGLPSQRETCCAVRRESGEQLNRPTTQLQYFGAWSLYWSIIGQSTWLQRHGGEKRMEVTYILIAKEKAMSVRFRLFDPYDQSSQNVWSQ